jgi:hypothetical protein
MNKFNTGRQYTQQGQNIVWEVQADGAVWFYDVSRGICGELFAQDPDFALPVNNKFVLQSYDSGNYRETPAAALADYDVVRTFAAWVKRALDFSRA